MTEMRRGDMAQDAEEFVWNLRIAGSDRREYRQTKMLI